MASSTQTSGDPVRRYEVIEKAYCEGRWATVLEAGTLLLREISEGEDRPDLAGLRHRMHLLMAHTLLHGYGDRDAAEDLYESVRKSDAESSLRQIAEDGLDQCHRPMSSSFVAEESEGEDGMPDRPELFLPETEQAEEAEPAPPQKQAEPSPPLAFHPPKAQPAEPEPQLEAQPEEAAPLKSWASSPEEEAPPDLGQAADPFHPPSVLSVSKTMESEEPVMPWLTPVESPPVQLIEERQAEPPQTNQEQPLLAPATLTLVPDVVEEPELIEVHQAHPSLAEEVDLEVGAEVVSLSDARAARQQEPFDDLEDLRASLVKVVVVA